MEALPEKPTERAKPDDADGDGLLDRDDPLPFDRRKATWD